MADEPAAPPKKKKKLKKSPAADAPAADAAEGEGGGGGSKTIIIAAAVAALMLGLGLGIGMFAGGMFSGDDAEVAAEDAEGEDAEGEEGEMEEERHRIYVHVGKLLATVEYNGATRYIQAEMDLVGYNKEVMDEAQHDMPAIRNRLLMLFASENFEEVKTVQGRQALLDKSRDAVNEVLKLGPKGDKIEETLFTAFVLQ